jgi:P27 family predicted phage terminase small subunit
MERVPDKIKKLRGTYTNHRARPEPETEPGMPTVPHNLASDAKLIWHQTAQLLEQMNCLVLADVFALEGFAKVAAEKRRVEEAIRTAGILIEAKDRVGNVVVQLNPLMKLDSDLDRRYLIYLSKLGLTPADRTRLVPNPTKREENGFKEFG